MMDICQYSTYMFCATCSWDTQCPVLVMPHGQPTINVLLFCCGMGKSDVFLKRPNTCAMLNECKEWICCNTDVHDPQSNGKCKIILCRRRDTSVILYSINKNCNTVLLFLIQFTKCYLLHCGFICLNIRYFLSLRSITQCKLSWLINLDQR